jgi:acetyl/propionyl-CoA carboxylase alpha subunit
VKPIRALLIANRGEIARRISRTARRMGIRVIAVYSEADAAAPHVREADAAICIGPPSAAESYLHGEAILDAARRSGADAVHPGYGFLSENAAFARSVTDAGLTWVGAPPEAILAMGLKDAAKRLMMAAGVPVTPGYLGEDQSRARLEAEAEDIGWPVLIKAVAGGGGKGMRAVRQRADFSEALEGARREAASAFGDDRVLLEKLIAAPRHIEVQIFADSQGNVVHLFERDCSLQRRHQKVIEEAPAPGMDAETRAAITGAAIRAATSVGYVGAGTVEFIADGSEGLGADRIWFMEMNTRLQVEHPVTEAVTGLDLVEWQLRVAAGEPLPLTQEGITLSGHAMEARLYAEDPTRGFLPSIGTLEHLRLPDFVRVDSGVEEGGAVSPFYDPMIAKLIAHAPTREAAADELARAARAVEVWPVKTNAAFLARCLGDADFVAGRIDTGFIGARIPALTEAPKIEVSPRAVGALDQTNPAGVDPSYPWTPGRGATGFRLNAPARGAVDLRLDGALANLGFEIADGGDILRSGEDETLILFSGGAAHILSRSGGPGAGRSGGAVDRLIRTPMPGRITRLAVDVGAKVKAGQTLVVLEAMKMEHALTAPADGEVSAVHVAEGDQVTEGFEVVVLKFPAREAA